MPAVKWIPEAGIATVEMLETIYIMLTKVFVKRDQRIDSGSGLFMVQQRHGLFLYLSLLAIN
jgi:hypothetical protein